MKFNIRKGSIYVQTGKLRGLIETFMAGGENAQVAYDTLKIKASTCFNLLTSGASLTKEQKDELAEGAYRYICNNPESGYTLSNIEEVLHYHPEASEDLKERYKELQLRHERRMVKLKEKVRKVFRTAH